MKYKKKQTVFINSFKNLDILLIKMHHLEIKQNFNFLKQERAFFFKYKKKKEYTVVVYFGTLTFGLLEKKKKKKKKKKHFFPRRPTLKFQSIKRAQNEPTSYYNINLRTNQYHTTTKDLLLQNKHYIKTRLRRRSAYNL